MFTLATINDVVQIHPTQFGQASYSAIENSVNEKYADKVINNVGLCIGFHSIVRASEGLIGHGTGIVNVNVDFKLIVWRPFKGEIIRATIAQSGARGIALANEFYDDLIVPPETLYEGTHWQKDEEGDRWNWVWHAGEEGQEYYFDTAESCLVRVEEEVWNDVSPDEAKQQADEAQAAEDPNLRMPPYRLRGSMAQTGLGPTLWWTGESAGAADAMDVDGEENTTNGA